MADGATEKPRVLLLDDERDFHALVRDWLARDYLYQGLEDGRRLLETMASFKPSVVVLDVKLPGSDGFELCRAVRSDERFRDVPVLFLTGCTQAADFMKTLQAGGTAYLMKPVSRKQLLAAVAELATGPVEDERVGVGD
jgi:DNA-binding response OmpR family regulator